MASYDSTRDAIGRGTDTAKAAATNTYNQLKQGAANLLSGSNANTNAQGMNQGLAGMDTHATEDVPRTGNTTVGGGSYGAYDTEGTAGTHGAPTITGTTGNLRAYEAMGVGGAGTGQVRRRSLEILGTLGEVQNCVCHWTCAGRAVQCVQFSVQNMSGQG